jgi:dolichol-phosphate mannosyltransferase
VKDLTPALSIVLPVYNEAGNLGELIRGIIDVCSRDTGLPGEIVVVDDASDDGSAGIVDGIAEHLRHPRGAPESNAPVEVRGIRLDTRTGQARALMTGFAAARGDLIASMDADGQYDPRDLPRLLAAMDGCDMVCGVRRRRADGLARKCCSIAANTVRNLITGDSTSDAGCTFRIMRRPCLELLRTHDGELAGCEFFFHPLMVRRKGLRVGEIEVAHRRRAAGASKYRLVRGRLLRGLVASIRAAQLR